MSKSRIEKEIVQLVFDAKDFAKGIKNSIDDMSQLRKSIDMVGTSNSFSELETSANSVDMSPLGKGIDTLSFKMQALAVTAGIMMADIAKSIIGGAKAMADAILLTPIKTGLEEYETQINAVQVILANTAKAGTTLTDVTAALDELNQYADLTIYNFTEMTKNIGTFTAAGVELDTSVAAIKGIANLAAVSGSSSVQAATGMYQLSQAISSGTVKLMDWNSVQNAGMGGQIFQDALMETARVHGIAIDNIIKNEGSFRDSLAKGWLSSDILLETLKKFTGDLTSEQLTQMGYTEEQIADIIKLGEMANDAATKIKTLTALKDTLNEALQSGWAVSWRIIIGDFEQAKELWGDVAAFFSDIIEGSSEARNEMLQTWADVGGRDLAIEGLFNVMRFGKRLMTGFGAALSDVFDGIGWRDLFQLTVAFSNFAKSLAQNHKATRTFRRIMRGVFAVLKIVGLAIGAVLTPFKFLVPILKMAAKNFIVLVAAGADIVFAFSEMAERTDYFGDLVRKAIVHIKEFAVWINELLIEFMKMERVKEVIAWFERVIVPLLTMEVLMYNLTIAAKALAAPFYLLAIGAKELYDELMALEEVQEAIAWLTSRSWTATVQYFRDMATGARDFFQELKDSETFGKFSEYIKTFDGRRLKEFFEQGEEEYGWLGETFEEIKLKIQEFLPTFDEFKAKMREHLENIAAGLGEVIDYLIGDAENLDYKRFFDVLNTGLLGALILSIRSIFTGGWFSDSDIGEGLADVVEGVGDTLGTFQNNIRADTLSKIATSIIMLAGAVTLLAIIPQEKLQSSSIAIGVMIAALFGSSGALTFVKPQDAIKASIALMGLSVAVGLFAIAMKHVSDLDPEELEIGMAGMISGITALVIAMASMSKIIGSGMGPAKTIGTLIAMSLGLLLLVGVIKLFGGLDPEVLAQGMIAVGVALYGLTWALLALDQGGGGSQLKASLALTGVAVALKKLIPVIEKFGMMDLDVLIQGLAVMGGILYGLTLFSGMLKTDQLLEASIGILVISAALFVLSEVVKRFGEMEPDVLINGMVTIAAALFLLVVAANAMQGTPAGAAAMLIMSVALIAIALAIKILAAIPWQQLLIAIGAIALVFVVLGVAGYLLAPVVPVLMLLAIAMLLIGAGAALMGLGLFLAAAGLVAIAGSAHLIAAAIRIVGEAIIETLPGLARALGAGIAGFITVIGDRAPEIFEAFGNIVMGMINMFVDLIPEMIGAVYELITAILETIAEKLPDLVDAGFEILINFLKGIGDNIAEVVEMGLYIITEFMAGIEKGIPDLVDQAFSLILTFLEAIADAVEEYWDQIIAAGLRIGEAIVTGLVDAIDAGLQAVKNAVLRLARKALDALGLGFLLGSPSRATYKMGEEVVQGFVNAMRHGEVTVRKAMEDFGNTAKKSLGPALQIMNEEIDRELVLEPVIRPILDIEQFSKDKAEMGFGDTDASGNLLPIYSMASDINRGVGHWAAPATYQDPATAGPGGTTFIQNNYSPKALDRATIYRQTKTQVARLKNEELL